MNDLFRATSPVRRGPGRIRGWAALAAAGGCALAGAAEEFPVRPVRLIVPFAAGGPADLVGRVFGQGLTEVWGRPVVVDNRAGASGVVGTDTALKANPDGHTILFGSTSTFAVNTILFRKLPYDFLRDATQIGLVAIAPHVLAVRANLPAATLAELIAAAKKQPGKLNNATPGSGTIVHLSGELFKHQTGVDIVAIQFKGGGPATLGVMSGEADMVLNDLSTLQSHIRSGRLRVLAAAHARRLPQLPETPTFAELGHPGVVSSTWWGVAVPAKTPQPVLRRIKAAYDQVLARPEYRTRLSELAIDPLSLSPEESATFIRAEIGKWGKVVKDANIPLN
jgi:tripartite-type tricarboxylate transporter receptor subunit TctC